MHLDTDTVQRTLHGELTPAEARAVQEHLRACERCQRQLADAEVEEEQVIGLLRSLDHPVPGVSAAEVIRRSAAATRWRLPRAAAGIALLLAGVGALYAIPGSPLPDLLSEANRRLELIPPSVPAPIPRPYASGVSVVPTGEFEVVFAAVQPEGIASVRLVDDPELSVRAIGEPVAFDLDVDRVTVANQGATADYEILLPRGAPAVSISVGGTTLLRADGDQVEAAVLPDEEGVYRLRVGGGGPR